MYIHITPLPYCTDQPGNHTEGDTRVDDLPIDIPPLHFCLSQTALIIVSYIHRDIHICKWVVCTWRVSPLPCGNLVGIMGGNRYLLHLSARFSAENCPMQQPTYRLTVTYRMCSTASGTRSIIVEADDIPVPT